jgi:signal transduction histidine kinase/CheY-like chemotaxis protein/HPt (histidine-containing phosphotransfer) domain-containing protein
MQIVTMIQINSIQRFMSKHQSEDTGNSQSVGKIHEKILDGRMNADELVRYVDDFCQKEVEKRKAIEKEISGFKEFSHKNARFFESLATNIPHTDVYIFDTSLKIILAQGKEMEKYGFSREHFEGNKLAEIYDDDTVVLLQPIYEDAIGGKKVSRKITYSKDPYLVNALPIRDNKGQVYAGMVVMTNISDEVNREQKLQKAMEDAESASRAKSEFMANMSHEIRTPLNSIMGFAEQMANTRLNTEQQKYTELIEESSEHLLSIVNEILILLKLGAGGVYIEEIPFDLNNLFNEVHNTFRIRAQKKSLNMNFQIGKEVPEVLIGDPVRLKQVMINLVSNALKFTQFGYIRWTARAEEQEDGRLFLHIRVKDTGIGIKKEEMDSIFYPFQQADSSVTRKFGGSGLGLTIVKKLVELQGGKIHVSSKEGKGTEFRFMVPYGIGNKQDLPEEERLYEPDRNLLNGIRVLIADDDETNQILACTILDRWKVKYDVANDGEEALRCLEKYRYDVVLMDIHLPRVSGMEVVKKVRSEENHPNVDTKFIAVTANIIKSDIRAYMDAGMDNYLIKPYREEGLFNKVCNVLKLKRTSGVINKELEGKTELDGYNESKPYDLNDLINVSRGDIQFYNKTLKSFVTAAEEVLLRIRELHENQQWQDLGEQAHKIISSSRFLGLTDVANICAKIEDNTVRSDNHEIVPDMVRDLSGMLEKILPQLKNEYIYGQI